MSLHFNLSLELFFVKFITEAKDFCVFFDGSYKDFKIQYASITSSNGL